MNRPMIFLLLNEQLGHRSVGHRGGECCDLPLALEPVGRSGCSDSSAHDQCERGQYEFERCLELERLSHGLRTQRDGLRAIKIEIDRTVSMAANVVGLHRHPPRSREPLRMQRYMVAYPSDAGFAAKRH